MRRSTKDTIAAVATPPGEGGVAIVRVSGPDSVRIVAPLFRASAPSFSAFEPHRMHHGRFMEPDGAVLDEVLCVHMPSPRSFTGEDVVEVHCHGGRAVVRGVLEGILAAGARLAERGEFTYRAFMNGRLDLTQAEAVAETIQAPTKAAVHLAQAKLSGLMGERIRELRADLETLRRELCVAVDFPEEELECLPPDRLISASREARTAMGTLLKSVDRARAWREGALVVLAGRVNAGKSSLMNALIGRDRAIVTDLPGTTRDYLEEPLNLDGLTVRLTDTAGLRATDDAVEAAGLQMGKDLMDRADLVLFLVDNSETLAHENVDAALALDPARTLVLLTKSDLMGAQPPPGKLFARHMFDCLKISARTGAGLDKLAARIRERVLQGAGQPDPDELVPNARQARCLERAVAELAELETDAAAGVPFDLLGVRLETACAELATITGEITPNDVLNNIFDNFCVGK